MRANPEEAEKLAALVQIVWPEHSRKELTKIVLKFDYTDWPSAYCLFETFCPSDQTEVLENALEWKAAAESLPERFSAQVQRIWQRWNENREKLAALSPAPDLRFSGRP